MRLISALAVSICLALGLASSAMADTFTLTDTYWGGNPASADADVIGSSRFAISKMTVSNVGDAMTFRIYTNFVDGGAGASAGAELGDLFLSTDGWSATGTGPKFVDDYVGTVGHEDWEYAITLDDYTWDYNNNTSGTNINDAGGTASLYDFSAGGTIKKTNDFFTSGYRNEQEARFTPATSQAYTSGGWDVNSDGDGWYLEYTITSSALSSAFTTGQLGVHWGMTCGNDVIAGLAVPEPGTMLLIGAGLLGAGAARRRRRAAKQG